MNSADNYFIVAIVSLFSFYRSNKSLDVDYLKEEVERICKTYKIKLCENIEYELKKKAEEYFNGIK